MKKKKPKNIPQDKVSIKFAEIILFKEKLYEETIHLKATINLMTQEINKLRTRNLLLEVIRLNFCFI